MADDKDKKEASAKTEGDSAPATGKSEKKSSSLLLIIIIALLVIIIGAGAFLMFTSKGRHMIGLEHQQETASATVIPELPKDITYYALPEMLVNIENSSGKRKPYLRLAVKLELHDKDDVKTLDKIKPRIIDSFQVYLRELRVEDLEGSAGAQRLKEELLRRVNAIAAPIKVSDVLFQTFVIQ